MRHGEYIQWAGSHRIILGQTECQGIRSLCRSHELYVELLVVSVIWGDPFLYANGHPVLQSYTLIPCKLMEYEELPCFSVNTAHGGVDAPSYDNID